jgi:hypothetical protein
MKPLVIVGSALVVSLGVGCGGGGSSSSPSAPTTTTPTPAQTGGTVTAYVSSDRTVEFSANDPTPNARVQPAGWVYAGQVFQTAQGKRYAHATASALKFDFPAQVMGRTVTKATLRLTVYEVRRDIEWNGPTATMKIELRVNAFTNDWDPASLSWNVWTSLGYQSDGEARAAAPNSLAPPVDFDVTTIVRNWASGAWKNYGLRLAADTYSDPGGDSYGNSGFYGSGKYERPEQRPQLIIEYQ